MKNRFSQVIEVPFENIRVSPNDFQGRQSEYSEDTVQAIVSKGFYDKSAEPIVVWEDDRLTLPGNYIVISGHSRFEAIKRLRSNGASDLDQIPVKIFNGTLQDAREYAVLESNRGGTEEGLLSDIKAFKLAKNLGKNKAWLKGNFRPESKFEKLDKLSYLADKGRFIEALTSSASNSYPYIERNATWVGTLRKMLPALTDAHENEIFTWMYQGDRKALAMSKEKFMNEVDKRVNRIDFDPDKPLNFANAVSANPYIDPLNEQIKDIEREIDKLGRERDKQLENIKRANAEAKQELIPKFRQRISDIDTLVLRKMQEQDKIRASIGNLERNTVADLFSMDDQPEPAPKKQPSPANNQKNEPSMSNKNAEQIKKLEAAMNIPGISDEERKIYQNALAKLKGNTTMATGKKTSTREAAAKYFKKDGRAKYVRLNSLTVLKQNPRKSIDTAKARMKQAAAGEMEKRAPINIYRQGKQWIVADGNATTVALQEMGYTHVPAIIVSAPNEGENYVAFYNGEKHEFKAESLYAAKKAAIKHFNVPKSKESILAVEYVGDSDNSASPKTNPIDKNPEDIKDAKPPKVKADAYTKIRYKGVFGDFDGDGILNVDDPNPQRAGDKETVEEIKLSDEIAALIDFRKKGAQTEKEFVEVLRKKAQGETDILSRTKTPYSIVNKMRRKMTAGPNDGLTDLVGTMVVFGKHSDIENFRDKVNKGELGQVLEFDDYYTKPKAGYMAYHWNVVYKGSPVEIQVKSERLKKIAGYTHTLYKTGKHNAQRQLELSQLAVSADKGDKAAAAQIDDLLADKNKVIAFLTGDEKLKTSSKPAPDQAKPKYKIGDTFLNTTNNEIVEITGYSDNFYKIDLFKKTGNVVLDSNVEEMQKFEKYVRMGAYKPLPSQNATSKQKKEPSPKFKVGDKVVFSQENKPDVEVTINELRGWTGDGHRYEVKTPEGIYWIAYDENLKLSRNKTSSKTNRITKKQQLAKQQEELKAYQSKIAKAQKNGLSKTEVIRIANKINSTRRLASMLIDGAQDHKDILAPTEDNLRRWAKNPSKYDLQGVDTATDKEPTKKFKKPYAPRKRTWWDQLWDGDN